jgi:mRNA interferase RelE/StbE
VAQVSYEVRLTPAAERDLHRLDRQHQRQVSDAIDTLATNPRSFQAQALTGDEKGYYRLRTGNYRIVYTINDKAKRVTVTRVGSRQGVYKG